MPYEAIPAELRQFPQWVLASAEKLPLQADGKTLASTTARNTWATFSTIIAAHEQKLAPHIGFVFSADDPFCGIDLDKSTDPEVIAFQRQVILAFADTYMEWSISGKGLHIICRAKIPHGRRRNGVEIYSSGRYFIMTGKVYHYDYH